MTAEITDAELQAFIDDQLDTEGRMDVLTHLLDNAPNCRRTSLDLRSREVMRALAERATLPSYYEETLEARRVALLRQAMVSQVETPDLDPKDIRTATRIRIPVLPHGWQIADVQLFPSDFGPAVQVSIRSAQGGSLFLFATHADTGAPGQPKVNRIGGTDLVAWSAGGNTYVLAGARLRGRLIDMADDLADNRFS
jgi:anti-sigma factor RsiW